LNYALVGVPARNCANTWNNSPIAPLFAFAWFLDNYVTIRKAVLIGGFHRYPENPDAFVVVSFIRAPNRNARTRDDLNAAGRGSESETRSDYRHLRDLPSFFFLCFCRLIGTIVRCFAKNFPCKQFACINRTDLRFVSLAYAKLRFPSLVSR